MLIQNFKGQTKCIMGDVQITNKISSSLVYVLHNFHVVVVQQRKRNAQNSVMHVTSCCFAF